MAINTRILVAMQHQLTSEQENQLMGRGTIVSMKEAHPELFNQMANSPSDEVALRGLAKEFVGILDGYHEVLLPLGSPALMMQIGMLIGVKAAKSEGEWSGPEVLFSHTNRVSEDQKQEDGSIRKIAVFRHEKFIVL